MNEKEIVLSKIDRNPYQTRTDFNQDKIWELAESIKSVGLLNRILVRQHPIKEGCYQLVHGERRLRAFKLLGRETIPAIVRELDDKQIAEMNMIENLQREDLNPINEARGYQALIEKFGYTKKELGEKIGKSRSYVSNSIRLLDMPTFLKSSVLCKTLSAWHTRTIMALPEGYSHQVLADLVMDWQLSVSETREIVNQVKEKEGWITWIRDLPVDSISVGPRFRTRFKLKRLMKSMRKSGQYVPITVYVTGKLADGNRRLKCAKKLSWKTIRAEIVIPRLWLQTKHLENGQIELENPNKLLQTNKQTILPEPSISEKEKMKNLVKLLIQTTTEIQELQKEVS